MAIEAETTGFAEQKKKRVKRTVQIGMPSPFLAQVDDATYVVVGVQIDDVGFEEGQGAHDDVIVNTAVSKKSECIVS